MLLLSVADKSELVVMIASGIYNLFCYLVFGILFIISVVGERKQDIVYFDFLFKNSYKDNTISFIRYYILRKGRFLK